MKKLYIIGARGFGREVYNLASDINKIEKQFEIVGFLDDNSNILDGYIGYPPIISSVESYRPKEDDVFVCALGDVKYKKKYIDIILSKGGNFINLIHPETSIGKNVIMGTGCIITRNVSISCDIKIGNYNTFLSNAAIGHDVQIGNYCQLDSFTFLGGFSKIEDLVTLHTGCIIHPHKKIGSESVVGAGSVVIRNVPNKTVVFGNPAKRL